MDTQFVPTQTVVAATWLNDVNQVVYRMLGSSTGPGGSLPANRNQILKNLGGAPVIPSIASLRALSKTDNAAAFVLGYYADGDGGGGAYWYNAADTTSADNGGTIIVGADGGRWYLQLTGAVSVKQFGAIGSSNMTSGNGADDTVAFVAAIAWCQLNGKPLYVPTPANAATPTAYRLTSTLTITANLEILGDSIQPYRDITNVSTTTVLVGFGSWLYFDHLGVGFSSTGAAQQPFRTLYKGIGTVRNQPTPNGATAWAAYANDYDFYNNNVDLIMEDVFCLNPTKFSYTTGGGRATYRNVRGQPLQFGIYTDTAYDVCRYEDIHFWPWWSQAQGVYNYQLANATAFTFARNDNPQLSNCFAFMYEFGLRMIANANGQVLRLKAVNCDFDSVVYGIVIAASATAVTAFFDNVSITGVGVNSAVGVFIDNTTTNCTVWLSGVYLANLGQSGVLLQGTGNQCYVGDRCFLQKWSMTTAGNAGFSATTGNTIQFDAIPEVTLPQNGALFLSSTGTFKGTLYRAHFTGTTGSSGQIGFTHNLGYNAVNIRVCPTIGAPALTAQPIVSSTTGVTVQFYNGVTTYNSSSVSYSVIIDGD